MARHLGRSRYVPLGYSRKYWYRDGLSSPSKTITTPGKGKLLYIDPNQLGLIAGKHVLVVDDAVSSGIHGVRPQAAGALRRRSGRHCRGHAPGHPVQQQLVQADGSAIPVVAAYDCPRMGLRADGWWPERLMRAVGAFQA